MILTITTPSNIPSSSSIREILNKTMKSHQDMEKGKISKTLKIILKRQLWTRQEGLDDYVLFLIQFFWFIN